MRVLALVVLLLTAGAVALAETPTVREVAVLRQRVGKHLAKLEDRRGRESVKDLRSAYRNITGNTGRDYRALQKLDARIERAMPIEVDPRCLTSPLCDK